MSDRDPSKGPPPNAIRMSGEADMSDLWRQRRDQLQQQVSETVQAVEASQGVLNGFGFDTELLGSTGNIKHLVEQARGPGLYLGVREANSQEASRVVKDSHGTVISYVRMPNFEPGHSKEIGEHVVQGGTAYEIGRKEFLTEGSTSSTSLIIDYRGMVELNIWSGQGSTRQAIHDEAKLAELQDWAQGVAAEITEPTT